VSVRLALLAAAAMTAQAAIAGPTSCSGTPCSNGTPVTSAPASGGPFLACPTAELTEYVNTVLGVVAMAQSIGSQTPPISRVTGEPMVGGPVATWLAELRGQAGVRTFDEAARQCERGPHSARLVVKSTSATGRSIFVATEKKPAKTFWMPSNSADAQR
jgi:hypothetical protein